jgi:hypothetical protein
MICSLCEMESIDLYSSPDKPTPWQLYKILTFATSAYCVLSLAALIISAVWPISVYSPLMMLAMPIFSIVHALVQRHLCSTVQLVHQYYAATLGLVYGILTVASASFLLSTGWESANGALKCLFFIQLFLGVIWMFMWIAIIVYRVLRKSAFQHQGGVDYSIFLLVRCGCVPSESKKMIIYAPLFVLGIFFLVESILTR